METSDILRQKNKKINLTIRIFINTIGIISEKKQNNTSVCKWEEDY